jgi:hypothetical protein
VHWLSAATHQASNAACVSGYRPALCYGGTRTLKRSLESASKTYRLRALRGAARLQCLSLQACPRTPRMGQMEWERKLSSTAAIATHTLAFQRHLSFPGRLNGLLKCRCGRCHSWTLLDPLNFRELSQRQNCRACLNSAACSGRRLHSLYYRRAQITIRSGQGGTVWVTMSALPVSNLIPCWVAPLSSG